RRRRLLRRGGLCAARPELLRPQRGAAVSLEALVRDVADPEVAERGREDVLAMTRRLEPAVHRLAGRAVMAGAPGDVLADRVAVRAAEVGREHVGEGVAAGRMAELAALDV